MLHSPTTVLCRITLTRLEHKSRKLVTHYKRQRKHLEANEVTLYNFGQEIRPSRR